MFVSGSDQDELGFEINSTARLLYDQRNEILDSWLAEVKSVLKAASKERDPILTNTLPAFIVNLAQALSTLHSRQIASDGTTIAQEHGGERARVTRYTPEEVVQEYQVLRDVILAKLTEKGPLSETEESIIRRSCDKAMTEALTSFFLVLNAIREQFAVTLTHDLRSPLSAMKMSAELIQRNLDDKEKTEKHAKKLLENISRMDRMIQDVLDASTVKSGESLSFNFSSCEMHSIAKNAVDEFNEIYGPRFVLEGEKVKGFWDCESIRRALENLCNNAIKYGDAKAEIKVKIEQTHGRVIVSVHNKGSYIASEDQESIFNSFMRTLRAKESKTKGWGIGLSLVRSVAEGHGGSVGVDSSLEGGTTFLIDILVDPRPKKESPTTPGAGI